MPSKADPLKLAKKLAKSRHKKAVESSRPIPLWAINKILLRVENAIAAGKIKMELDDYISFLCAIMPEEFVIPSPKPTATEPETEERMIVYSRRARERFELFHKEDARTKPKHKPIFTKRKSS